MSHNGIDSPGCGHSSSPCASVRFAVVNESRVGDTINIDHSNGEPYKECTYTSPILIEKSLSFIGRNGKAIIQCNLYNNLFIILGEGLKTIVFENLVLRNAKTAIDQQFTSSYLTIKRCTFTRNNVAVLLNTTVCTLNVFNSTFNINGGSLSGIRSYCSSFLRVNLTSSNFNSTSLLFQASLPSKLFKLFISQCSFYTDHKRMVKNAILYIVCIDVEVIDIKIHHVLIGNYNYKKSVWLYGILIWLADRLNYYSKKTSVIFDRVTVENNEFYYMAVSITDGQQSQSIAHYKILNCVFHNNTNCGVAINGSPLTVAPFEPINVLLENNTLTKNYNIEDPKRLFHNISTVSTITLVSGIFAIKSCRFLDNSHLSSITASVVYIDGIVSVEDCYFENSQVRGESVQIYSSPNAEVKFLGRNHFNMKMLKFDQFIVNNMAVLPYTVVTTVSDSFIVQCPQGFKLLTENITKEVLKHSVKFISFSVSCERCPRKTYSVERGAITNRTVTQINCYNCPRGGQCEDGILKAKPNFWGYVNQKQVSFLSCPSRYCCSKDECTTYNSCYGNRTGHLCGRCPKGMSEPLFSTKCKQNQECSSFTFWVGVSVLLLLSFLFFLYQSEITAFLLTGLFFLKPLRFRSVSQLKVSNEYFTLSPVGRNESTGSGFLKIIFYYYQVIHIFKSTGEWSDKQNLLVSLQDHFTKAFNFIIGNFYFIHFDCPLQNVTPIKKTVLLHSMGFFLIGITFLTFLLIQFYKLLRRHKTAFINNEDLSQITSASPDRPKSKSIQNLSIRLLSAFTHISLLVYSSSARLVFTLLQCVPFGDHQILFIDGTVACHHTFQYFLIAYVVLSTLPYFLVPVLGSYVLLMGLISVFQFCLGCLFPLPFSCYWLYLLLRKSRPQIEGDADLITEEGDTADILSRKAVLNSLSGPFRRHRRFMCFCSSHLPWEGVLIFRRLIIVIAFTFIYDIRIRMMVILTMCVLILVSHLYIEPFEAAIDNFLETLSLSILTILCGFTLVKAFYHGEDYSSYSSSSSLIHKFNITESILILAPITIVILVAVFGFFLKFIIFFSFVLTFIYRKLRCLLNNVILSSR